ncbi:MAG: MBL fold metallo-hydrolase [Deltaproteobacteria bacterium]|nr:MBL fold metallo-hydrolase [Deltaproteobacteria bacterium]MBW2634269.1 MBL fold metallo-hydrolase [Deltaproteobacteria bacterium]MBW2676019.1 MBL fold metallo-hydrolase [Deltaproteobacteria bacterium]
MYIKQFKYGTDNLSYLIYGENSVLAIDGGAVEAILDFIGSAGLELQYITNTHAHPDHTSGNRGLLEKSDARILDHNTLAEDGRIVLDNETIRIYPTPGHTLDSVTFHWDRYLITGDTLFNGTVGTCFSGDLKAFYRSIQHLVELPGDTVVYAGHDYLEYAMAFARLVEPDNPDIDGYLAGYTPEHVFSRLEDELKVNPFLRYNHPEMIAILEERGSATASEYQRFESVMHLE